MPNETTDFRTDAFRRLAAIPSPDVLILGGGINGIATLREMSLNGVSAVLIDTGDFCSGASGGSTRLAHGGLRYLENREFDLVREALRERDLLLRIAPHATVPIRVTVPLQSIVRGFIPLALRFLGIELGRSQLNFLSLKAAVTLYEFLTRRSRTLPRHKARAGKGGLPKGINAKTKASISYYDGRFVFPESLALEILEAALAEASSVAAINYVNWRFDTDGGIVVHDPDTGADMNIRPKVIVNATGAWLDHTNSLLGLESQYISAVRGAHIVLKHDGLRSRLGENAYYFDDGNGRMVFCCPLDRTVLMGTTEVPCAQPEFHTIEQSEIDYLLEAISELFDDLALDQHHIVAATTGVRPLRKTSLAGPYRAAREHETLSDMMPGSDIAILSLAGGKWTTFRSFAESVADQIFGVLKIARKHSTEDTRSLLGAGAGNSSDCEARLVERYGLRAAEVAAHCQSGEDRSLKALPDYTQREIAWLVRNRGANRLDDVLVRRTTIALDGRASDEALEEIANEMAATLKKGDAWAAREIQRCKSLPQIRFGG